MQKKVYAIRDAKSEVFLQPFFKITHGDAERDFRSLVNDTEKRTFISQYPEDYDLYYLGEYDDQTGFIASLDTPQHVTKAVNVLKPKTMPDLSAVPAEMRN